MELTKTKTKIKKTQKPRLKKDKKWRSIECEQIVDEISDEELSLRLARMEHMEIMTGRY